MAHRSDRRGDTPITRLALGVVEQRLAPRVRISMMARSDTLHLRGRRYVGSLTRCLLRVADMATALRARQGPSAAYGGALRAALTRAHAEACSSDATKDLSFVADQRKGFLLARPFLT